MIHLVAAITFSSLIVLSFKLFDRFKIDVFQAVTVNYLVAVAYGLLTSPSVPAPAEIATMSWLPFALANGLFFIMVISMFGLSTQRVGIALTSVSSKMSVVWPVLLGFLILGESASGWRLAGIAAALTAFYLTFRKKGTPLFQTKPSWLPLLLFCATGINDSLMKYAESHHMNQHQTTYLLVVFATALLLGIGLLAVRHFKPNRPHYQWRNLLGGIALGIFNWLSTLMMIRAMASFDSSVLFPVFNASIVTIAALMGFIFFGERLKPVNWAGIALAIAAIVLTAG